MSFIFAMIRTLASLALALQPALAAGGTDDTPLVQRYVAGGRGSLATETLEVETRVRRVTTVPNWALGPYSHCAACSNLTNVSVKTTTVECKSSSTGEALPESACSAASWPKPSEFQLCSCALEVCPEEPIDCSFIHNDVVLPALNAFTLIGCFELLESDSANSTCPGSTQDSQRDLECMTWEAAGQCHSGLPFYRNCSIATAKECSEFCVHHGFDVMGLVKGSECRCGTSKLNEQVWHRKTPPGNLLFDENALTEYAGGGTCPLLVGRYPGEIRDRGVPARELKDSNLADTAYVDSIVVNHTVEPESEEERPLEEDLEAGGKGRLGTDPGWTRNCWPSNCGPGRGQWIDRVSTAPSGVTDNFHEYITIPYTWNDGVSDGAVQAIDETRKAAFRDGVTSWHTDTCIVLQEVATPPSDGRYIEVGVYDLAACYVAGMGYGKAYINLGWCDSSLYHGSIVHEIGHAIGMNHEQKRADAQQTYHGQGPYLTIYWQNIPDNWVSQYTPDETTYIGSANDGAGDPHEGYAAYDFGSIMHYPKSNRFETIPSTETTGQRAGLSAGDISNALDLYQCWANSGVTSVGAWAGPTNIIASGFCVDQNGFNGPYTYQGNTHSGAPYYKGDSNNFYLYYDPSCNGGTYSPYWAFITSAPSTTAENNLNGASCSNLNAIKWEGQNVRPALGTTEWLVWCSSSWTATDITILDGTTVTTTTVTTTSVTTTSVTTTSVTTTSVTTTTVTTTTTTTVTTTTVTTTTVTTTSITTTTTVTTTTVTTTTVTTTSVTTTTTTTVTTTSVTTTTTTTVTTTTSTTTTVTTTSVTTTSVTTTSVTTTTTTTTRTGTTTTVTTTTVTTTSVTTTTVTTTSVTTTTTITTTSVTTTTVTTTTVTTTTVTTTTVTTTTTTATTTTVTTTSVTTTTTVTTSTVTTTTVTTSSVTTTTTTTLPTVEQVVVEFTVNYLNYNDLVSNQGLEDSFTEKVKEVIAEHAGYDVTTADVDVNLQPGSQPTVAPGGYNKRLNAKIASGGSVNVIATIDESATVNTATVKAALEGASTAVQTDVLTEVQAIPGIEAATSGALEVTPPVVTLRTVVVTTSTTTTVTTIPPPTTTSTTGTLAEWAWPIISAGSLGGLLALCR